MHGRLDAARDVAYFGDDSAGISEADLRVAIHAMAAVTVRGLGVEADEGVASAEAGNIVAGSTAVGGLVDEKPPDADESSSRAGKRRIFW